MAVANLSNTVDSISDGNDSIVIINNVQSKQGGATLDTTGFTPEVIKAGHVIIQETATGNYKPMPVSGAAYAALPAGHTYAGVLVASIRTAKPFAGILIMGVVNPAAMPYPLTPIAAAFKTAIPTIAFQQD